MHALDRDRTSFELAAQDIAAALEGQHRLLAIAKRDPALFVEGRLDSAVDLRRKDAFENRQAINALSTQESRELPLRQDHGLQELASTQTHSLRDLGIRLGMTNAQCLPGLLTHEPKDLNGCRLGRCAGAPLLGTLVGGGTTHPVAPGHRGKIEFREGLSIR